VVVSTSRVGASRRSKSESGVGSGGDLPIPRDRDPDAGDTGGFQSDGAVRVEGHGEHTSGTDTARFPHQLTCCSRIPDGATRTWPPVGVLGQDRHGDRVHARSGDPAVSGGGDIGFTRGEGSTRRSVTHTSSRRGFGGDCGGERPVVQGRNPRRRRPEVADHIDRHIHPTPLAKVIVPFAATFAVTV
jgi:hypothetical protein